MNNPQPTRVVKSAAAVAFEAQSDHFDALYGGNTIIRYKRERVRRHAEIYLHPESRILELNAGTGEDAVYFAGKGHYIQATDISRGMLSKLEKKAKIEGVEDRIRTEICSFEALEGLIDKGPYDMIFSNFAGLNCTGRLDKVLRDMGPLLKKNGILTLVIMPGFCLWESLLMFRGKFRTATRRLFSKSGVEARIDGNKFTCWYYAPGFVRRELAEGFELLKTEGLCTLVPPSYFDHFAEKHPGLYRKLVSAEERLKYTWPWKLIGDYYIISLRKKS